ncbi:response regulator [Dongshaea marina]|uniref:response regulator n=1 Tax=Dongshaea marina TaxID=2047966 RepID=UPI000D3E9987|nr:response regulator [Dongshaea marina]
MQQHTVLVIDDHPLIRRGIIGALSSDTPFEVIAEAGDGQQGLELALELDPDLILLDLNMKGLSGLETLRLLRQKKFSNKVALFTVSDKRQDVINAIRYGADGYLLKDSEPTQLIMQLRHLMSGQRVVSPAVHHYLDQLHQREHSLQEKLATLTRREWQILRELSQGLSNKQIALNLTITAETVKAHVKNLLRKLEVGSRTEAAILYHEQLK